MSPEQYLTLARMSKATVCCTNPLRPVVAFSHEAWLEFCKKLEEASRKDTSPVTTLCQKPVAEVIVSHVRSGLDGRYTAEIAGYERLSVGAELFVHPQTINEKPVAWIENVGGGICYNPHHEAARKLPNGVRFDLYTHPQPKLEPLTDEDIRKLIVSGDYLTAAGLTAFARSVERKIRGGA